MLVTTENFGTAIEQLDRASQLVVDCETPGLNPYGTGRLTSIAILNPEHGEPWYFPFRHVSESLPLEYLAPLRQLLRGKRHLGHNYKFDLKWLLQDGFELPEHADDTQLAAHLLNENEKSFALKTGLGAKYLGNDSADEQVQLKMLLAKNRLKIDEMWKLPASLVEPYACKDVLLTAQLHAFQKPHLATWRLESIYQQMCEFQLVCTRMEARGVQLDVIALQKFSTEAKERASQLQLAINNMAGKEINPNSPKQLCEWLAVPSTDQKFLAKFAGRADIKLLGEYRSWYRAGSHYYGPLDELKDGQDRFHPDYRITGTVSGRLSAPIIHQIPRYDEDAEDVADDPYQIKRCFIASPGMTLVSHDYSQIEPRVVASLADEESMIQFFRSRVDFYSSIAKELGIKRSEAKTLVLATLYGMGAALLASKLGVSIEVAQSFLDKFFQRFPKLRNLVVSAESTARRLGYIRLPSGRLRRFNCAEAPAHKAFNNLGQGAANDVALAAMVQLDQDFRGSDTHLVLTVHDEIAAECPSAQSLEVARHIKKVMEHQPQFKAPIVADTKIGNCWATLEKVKWEQ